MYKPNIVTLFTFVFTLKTKPFGQQLSSGRATVGLASLTFSHLEQVGSWKSHILEQCGRNSTHLSLV